MEQNTKSKKPITKKWWFWAIIVVVFLMAVSSIGDDENKNTEDTNATATIQEETPEPTATVSPTATLEITGEFILENTNDGIKGTFNSNIEDGAIIQLTITSTKLDIQSEEVLLKDGKAEYLFTVPKEDNWEISQIVGSASLQFNVDSIIQPNNIKELYGAYGEKLSGDYVMETTNIEGNCIIIKSNVLCYPSKSEYDAAVNEVLLTALDELIKASDGVIIKVQPYLKDNEWSSVAVTVSDAWYNSAEHEKERFAEQVSETVKKVIHNSGKMSTNDTILVYFFDTYQKELASPKILGGYKIKK